MELKEYQIKALEQVKKYLDLLSEWREKAAKNPDAEIDWPAKAWEKMVLPRSYIPRKNGIGQPLPNFCIKIPTGGGKTLLAVKMIDSINTIYRKKRTGLILWIVPSDPIYKQTIKKLRDRTDPYRQHLDIASGGRTMIIEKTSHFSPTDVKENLVVLMLMLPSANRQSKETLRMFKDNGGFQSFFPEDDDRNGQEALLEQVPDLDVFGGKNGFWGKQVKTSLGNTLRLLAPVIILDEGHKAYSDLAQTTLRGFNPSIILELSATPPDNSNVLVNIPGIDLAREDMIKLDLHVINKASPEWKNTLLASIEKRDYLEEQAKTYDANTGNYIRPICLIQVERTSKDQHDGRHIHSEDIRDYLVKTRGIPFEQVAVTSAELKELEGHDLFARDCPIRYIITKHALQEGWDCSFAYVLSVLTNPASRNALTQLVGRILRQPYARKTKIPALDESYVFTFRQQAADILKRVKEGFEDEGLGDLTTRVNIDENGEDVGMESRPRMFEIRKEFRASASSTVLPVFIIKDGKEWRGVSYEMDILSRIPWDKADISSLATLSLEKTTQRDIEVAVSLTADEKKVIKERLVSKSEGTGLALDSVFLTRHIIDIVPNPWIAYDFGSNLIKKLVTKHGMALVINNFVFIIDELRNKLIIERDRLAQAVFEELIAQGQLRFMVIGKELGFKFPKKIEVSGESKTLTKSDGQPMQHSLFEYVPEENLNELERKVAWYLEDQEQLFFWYRNIPRLDYGIQGWQKHKIYPDFIYTKLDSSHKNDFDKVFVVETKGLHLKNEDTKYKKSVFDICNRLAKEQKWEELRLTLVERSIKFEVIYQDEWKNKLNELMEV